MDYVRFHTLFQTEGLRLGQAAVTDMDAPVPSCPGWTVADVVRHSVIMYTSAAGRLSPAGRPDDPVGADRKGLLDSYVRAHSRLASEMARRDPSEPLKGGVVQASSTIDPDDDSCEDRPAPGTVGSLFRRMANEAAVHRADVELALGTPGPLDNRQALDGIDEALTVLLPGRYDGRKRDAAAGRTIGVNTARHHWRVTLHPGGIAVSHDPGFADAAVSGEPAELLLYLWGRRPGTIVSRTGDHVVLAAFRTRLAQSML